MTAIKISRKTIAVLPFIAILICTACSDDSTVAQNAGENENFGQDSIDGILACNTEANNVNVDDRTQMTELELQHGTAWDSIRLLGSKQRKVNGSHGIIYQTGLESIPGAGEASLLTRTSLREDCLQQN